MARVPEGATLIENRLSGAPGIRLGSLFLMAGVPHIAGEMLESLSGQVEAGADGLAHDRLLDPGERGRRIAQQTPRRAIPAPRSAAIRSSATVASAPISSSARPT